LPDVAGETVDPGPFAGPGGAVTVPFRLVAGDAAEVSENRNAGAPLRLAPGSTVNGRIEKQGESDHYFVSAKAGEPLRIKVEAESLGSWLDSVVRISDRDGHVLAENDDPPPPPVPWSGARRLVALADSVLDYRPAHDGDLSVEIGDRYGRGGCEYGYRVTFGPPRADFWLWLHRDGPEAVNLIPGESAAIDIFVLVDGRPGPISIRALGLAGGVSAETVTIRTRDLLPGPRDGRATSWRTAMARLVLTAGPAAGDAVGWFRIEATSRDAVGRNLTRHGSLVVRLGQLDAAVPQVPVMHELTELPVSIVRGEVRK
jgi:hypothetical protein